MATPTVLSRRPASRSAGGAGTGFRGRVGAVARLRDFCPAGVDLGRAEGCSGVEARGLRLALRLCGRVLGKPPRTPGAGSSLIGSYDRVPGARMLARRVPALKTRHQRPITRRTGAQRWHRGAPILRNLQQIERNFETQDAVVRIRDEIWRRGAPSDPGAELFRDRDGYPCALTSESVVTRLIGHV